MRRIGAGLAVLALLGACNQILGNDDGHHLIADVEPGAGSGGSSAQGGKTSGTSGKTSSSGSQSDAGAGAVSSVGGAGDGGDDAGGPCVATGAEDCLNGEDDDCNGATDCEDAACEALTGCVAVPNGASLGYFLAVGNLDCAQGYTAVTLHQGLSAAPECTGCTCTPDTADCDAGVIASQPGTCPGFQTMGNLYNVFASGCHPVSVNSTAVHYYDIRGLAQCTAGGVGVLSTPAWDTTRTFCELKAGKGCGSGSVCAPAADSMSNCARVPGGQHVCSGGFTEPTGAAWSPDYTDDRTCTCQCSFGQSTCGAARIQVFSGPNCDGAANAYLGQGDQGDACSLPFTPQSGIITGGVPGTNDCPVDAAVSGGVTADSPDTICCR